MISYKILCRLRTWSIHYNSCFKFCPHQHRTEYRYENLCSREKLMFQANHIWKLFRELK